MNNIITVNLLIEGGIVKEMEISKELLVSLIDSLNKKGKEVVYTKNGYYEVKGVLVGNMEGELIML